MTERASMRSFRFFTNRHEASKFVRSHLCMFISNEWKCSKDAVRCWYSGQTKAAPAYAASTCTQISPGTFGGACFARTDATAAKSSTAQVAVVPNVVVRKNGSSPSALHCFNVSSSASPVKAKLLSFDTGMERNRTPAICAAFCVALWAASLPNATSLLRLCAIESSSSRPDKCDVVSRRYLSRAATITVTMASEAEPWITPPPWVVER